MHGLISGVRRSRQRRRHSQFRHGERIAVNRAITSASIWLGLVVDAPTLEAAAQLTGSNPNYVMAAAEVIKSGDDSLLKAVRNGRVSLLAAAKTVHPRNELIRSLHQASPEDRIAAIKMFGVDAAFDEILVPAL